MENSFSLPAADSSSNILSSYSMLRPLVLFYFISFAPLGWGAVREVKDLLNPSSFEDVGTGEFSWIVGLLDVTLGDEVRKLVCGGSVLSPIHVLTSGRCVTEWVAENMTHNILPTNFLRVLAGDNNRMEDEESEQFRSVKEIILHPQFQYDPGFKGEENIIGKGKKGFRNDLAILVVDPPFNFSNGVEAIPLGAQENLLQSHTQSELVIAGWGITNKRQTIPTGIMLKKVELPFFPQNNVQQQKKGFGLWREEGDMAQLESGIGNNKGLMGRCMGDPGGGVLMKGPQGWVLVGVVSFGIWCDRYIPSGQLLLLTPQQWDWVEEVVGNRLGAYLLAILIMIIVAALIAKVVWAKSSSRRR